MQENFNLEELRKMIKYKAFKEGDKIYCNKYPSTIFIFEKGKFMSYYVESGHDLFCDGPLEDLTIDNNCIFSTKPFGLI